MGTVYVIRHGESDLYKIGYTGRSAEKRLGQHQVSNPVELELADQFAGTEPDESALHDALSLNRHRGEWYRLPPSVLDSLDQWARAHTREADNPYPPPKAPDVAELLEEAERSGHPARNRALVLGLYDLQKSPQALARMTWGDLRSVPLSRARRAFDALSVFDRGESQPVLPKVGWDFSDGRRQPTTGGKLRWQFRELANTAGLDLVAGDVCEMGTSRHPDFRDLLEQLPLREVAPTKAETYDPDHLRKHSASNFLA